MTGSHGNCKTNYVKLLYCSHQYVREKFYMFPKQEKPSVNSLSIGYSGVSLVTEGEYLVMSK